VLSAPDNLYPGGIDTMGHLTKVYCLAERWRHGVFSDWFPEWYMGATLVQYYPPLSIWVSALIQLLTSNIMVTFKIVTWSCLFLGGVAAVFLAKRLGANTPAATAAGIFYCSGNYTLFTVFVDGTLGRAFSLPLYPLLLWCFIDLTDKRRRLTWIASSVCVLGLVLCHAMHAYLLFLTAAVFMLVWCLKCRSWFAKVGQLAEVGIVGVSLSAFWAIPGATQLETPGIPWSLPEMAGIRTVSLSTFLDPRSPYGSTAVAVLAFLGILSLAKRPDRRHLGLSLAASSVITISLMYGPKNPLYNLLPMGKSLAPLRFMNAAVLPLALSAGVFVGECHSWICSQHWMGSGIAAALLSLAFTAISLFSNARVMLPAPTGYPDLVSLIDRIPVRGSDLFGSGRVAEELPRQGGEAAFLPIAQGFQITAGWNIEGTVHLYTLHNHNIAYADGNVDYVLRNWYLWNVRAALVDTRYTGMIETMAKQGWRSTAVVSRVALMSLDKDSSYITYLGSNTIVVGRSSFYFCSLFPFVTEGRQADPLKYDERYLQNFKCIILYDLPSTNKELLEKRIIGWVRAGKTVIVDLSVSDAIGDLLGVSHRDVVLSPAATLTPTYEGSTLFRDSIQVPLKDGRGAVYDGLDTVLLKTMFEGESLSICGTREMDGGSVFFVGGHLARLVDKTGRERAKQVLGPLLQMGGANAWVLPERLNTLSEAWSPKGVSFEYEVPDTTPIVFSVTYTPRWHAFVDGVRQPTYPHENMVLLTLPAGHHSVQLIYGGTWVTLLGWVATTVALMYVAFRSIVPIGIQKRLLSLR
jgi:hypothetical protein